MSLSQAAIQEAVRAWHNRHPLAVRIGADAVNHIGWVSLPFMGAAQAVEPSLDGEQPLPPSAAAPLALPLAQRLRQALGRPFARWRSGSGPWPVFTEVFIERLGPASVAAFARRCAWSALDPNGADWPQRQVAVDGARAEACSGAWPLERWLVAAAIEVKGRKLRVLVGQGPKGLEVLGAGRHWARPLVMALGASALSLGALGLWLSMPNGKTAVPTPAPVASAALSASAPAAAASVAAIAHVASGVSSAPSAAASEPVAVNPSVAASMPAPLVALPSQAPASTAMPPTPVASGPASAAAAAASDPPDIRPRLGPSRRSPARSPKAVLQAAGPSAAATAAEAPASAGSKPYRGAQDPENLRPRAAAQGPQVALVSPGFAKRADAEAQLERMRAHVAATTRDAQSLEGEVFETPLGWRAAVWPFGTREEAQIVNATMVARGWKTRAVDF